MIYNPAGLINVRNPSLSLTHFSSFVDTNYEYLAFGAPLGPGTAGVSVLFCYSYDFPEFNEWGAEVGDVSNHDIVATTAYAYKLMPGLAAGVNLKFFYSRLYIYSKIGIAFDAGMLFNLGLNPDVCAGIAVQNIGDQGAFISVKDPLPSNVKAGMSVKLKETGIGTVTLAMDVNRLLLRDEMPTLDIGGEVEIFEVFCVRAGYGFRHDVANMSAGMGLIMGDIRFSYAFQPFDMLGTTHRFSLDVEFVDKKQEIPENQGVSGR